MKLPQGAYLAGEYDVIVVGGGHAGCEAAAAAARMGTKTLLISMNLEILGLTPCNPSVGGPAKSTLVREVDACGGVIGRIADQSQIQIRLLNSSKGVAVQALRAQIDKPSYMANMKREMENTPNLTLRQGEVQSLIIENGRVCGVLLAAGAVFACRAVVLTCGTYLDGRVVIGEYSLPSGPAGYPPATRLGAFMRDLGLEMCRFKTGTPARLDEKSIDFSVMQRQDGDLSGLHFSYLTTREQAKQRPMLPCWLSYTNQRTHEVIRENLHRSPLFSGIIEGIGPRYCPSIEDKVVRFAEREAHQLFLEPEGLTMREYYVQGMSSSLPEEVQLKFLQTIKGLEHCVIVRPAYAIEYDCLQPTQLKFTLEHKEIAGLFSAGQLNGTSGYEEAAAQGLYAGANAAAFCLGKEPLLFDRSEALTGVMLDDLLTKGVQEPYRLFTSLAEYRLLLRQDNADLRLSEKAFRMGLIDEARYEAVCRKQQHITDEIERLENSRPDSVSRETLQLMPKGDLTFAAALRRQDISYDMIKALTPPPVLLTEDEEMEAELEIKYKGYIEKQKVQAQKFLRLEHLALGENIDYEEIKGLSNEARQKLIKFRPLSIGQASRITGISPADINVLLIYLEARRRKEQPNA